MQRLTDADLNYVPEPPFFVQMGAPDIAELDAELSNFDSDLLILGLDIASEPDLGGLWDIDLGLMAFNPGDFQVQNYDSINADHANFLQAFEGQLSSTEQGLAGDPSPGGGSPQPPPGPAPPGPGSGTQPPAPVACNASAFPGITCKSIMVLNPRILNDSPPTQAYVSADQRYQSAQLVMGDPSVWSLAVVTQPVSGGGPFGSGPIYNVILTAQLHKAGTFAAAVSVQLRGWPLQTFCYCITIG